MSNEIREMLGEALAGACKVAVLGCGSVMRGDDAAGHLIAERLSGLKIKARAFCGSSAPENFSGEIKRFCPDTLLVIDAADLPAGPDGSKKPAGTVELIPPETVTGATFTTHMLPLRVMMDYLHRETGCKVLLLGIQAQSLDFADGLTPPVAAAADTVVAVLTELLGN
ncbi:MAG: hydrogenase 3 maturation endopeptidase HyCI [Treponema sp.]|nr:hydrogenase 3 maturation endopeptidase HyCI [Treponema sp.]